jgi:ketosteroid isomerase-like protein
MTPNKRTVQAYMEAFSKSDHTAVLDCLTEDVEWLLPGAFHVTGKAAFDAEIENDGFSGKPEITVHRMTEEDEVVIAEGAVRATTRDGTKLHLLFCDVFEMEKGKIRKLTSYMAGGDAEAAFEAERTGANRA